MITPLLSSTGEQPANNEGLAIGRLVSVYRPSGMGWPERILWGATLFIGLGLFLISAVVYTNAYHHYGPAAADDWSLVWTLLAWAVLGISLVAFALRLIGKQWRVGVYEQGLLLERPLRRKLPLAWSILGGIANQKIEMVSGNQVLWSQMRIELFTSKGEKLQISNRISMADELCTRIKANLYPRILPDMRVTLRDGKFLSFGCLTISQQGLWFSRTGRTSSITWQFVDRITIQNGRLVIECTQPKRSIKVSAVRVPNLELLLQLVREEIH